MMKRILLTFPFYRLVNYGAELPNNLPIVHAVKSRVRIKTSVV